MTDPDDELAWWAWRKVRDLITRLRVNISLGRWPE